MADRLANHQKKTGRWLKEDGNYENMVDRLLNSQTPFFETRVVFKNPQLVLNADIPLSERRDDITEQNNATVSKVGPEYRVRATADTDSLARLRTRQRGNYLSGSVLEPGMGVRIPTLPTGDAYIRWGYFTENDGIFFEADADGIYVVVRRNATDARVEQANWNIDTLDGSKDPEVNPTGATLDLSDGHIFQMPFVYYGYGAVRFEIGSLNRNNEYVVAPVHSEKMIGQTSTESPNVPLTIEVDSGTSGQQLDCFVGGRQISPLGSNDNTARSVAAYRLGVGSIGTSFRPMISFQHKSGFENILIRLAGLSIIPDVDMIVEIHRNATINGGTFTTPGNHVADEIATEWNVGTTTTYTPGETIYEDFVAGGNKGVVSGADLPPRPISELDTITLALRRVSGTNGSASALLRVNEDW